MKYTFTYTEQCFGRATFEADSIEQAKELVRRYNEGENVPELDDLDKSELEYELVLDKMVVQ